MNKDEREFLSKHNYRDFRDVKIKNDIMKLYKANKLQKHISNATFKSYNEALTFGGKAINTAINFISNISSEAYRSFDSRIESYQSLLDNENLSENEKIEIMKIQDDIMREKIQYIENTKKEIISFVLDGTKIVLAAGGLLLLSKSSNKFTNIDGSEEDDDNHDES